MDLQKFRTLARNWEAFADADPLFGILSDPTRHGGQWGVDEFFASGTAHVQKLFRMLNEHEVRFASGSCLDFGCGVGRLTIPLSESFDHTVGVDVAKSMIDVARRQHRAVRACQFVVNRDPDLRRFRASTFDMVHSCLVLQHIPPEIALRYIAEFFRVSKPDGLVVFQLPAEAHTESAVTARYALPDAAYASELVPIDPPTVLRPGEAATIRVLIANESTQVWPHDIPAGRHISIANHWLRQDGLVEVPDDGRALLPQTLAPGQRCEVELVVRAPDENGVYLLEIDLVQERVCWFAEKGSRTTRVSIAVDGPPVRSGPSRDSMQQFGGSPRPSLLRRVLRPLRRGTPSFEMHVVPRHDVEDVIRASGGELLQAIDDGAAGYRWLSYTYIARRSD
jgi:SAM-dependent methyltransferase